MSVMAEDKIIDPIEKIEGLSKISGSKGIAADIEPTQRVTPSKEHFDALMDKSAMPIPTREESNISLMDTVRDMNSSNLNNGTNKPLTHETLVHQTQEAINQIDQIKQSLETPNLEIKSSVQQLLNNKLSHVNDSLNIALSRTGLETNNVTTPDAVTAPNKTNPIEKFLDLLTDGQNKLYSIGDELSVMSSKGQQLTPVNMLAVQVKVGQIQQELELFYNLLNSALSSIKSLMNTQV